MDQRSLEQLFRKAEEAYIRENGEPPTRQQREAIWAEFQLTNDLGWLEEEHLKREWAERILHEAHESRKLLYASADGTTSIEPENATTAQRLADREYRRRQKVGPFS